MTHRHLITDPTTAGTFIMAGKSFFTVANTNTETHATYRVERKVEQDDDGNDVEFHEVALFTGTDNNDRGSYTIIGRIDNGTFTCTLKTQYDVARELIGLAKAAKDEWLTGFCKTVIWKLHRGIDLTNKQAEVFAKNCRRHQLAGADTIAADDPKVRGFVWVKGRADNNWPFPAKVQFWTEGRCCTCGKRLTNPESIHDLEGPVCKRRRGSPLTGKVLTTVTPEHEDA